MNHGIHSYKKKGFLKKLLAFSEFSPDFQSENGFEFAKDRRIKIRGSFRCIEKNVLTPLPNEDLKDIPFLRFF